MHEEADSLRRSANYIAKAIFDLSRCEFGPDAHVRLTGIGRAISSHHQKEQQWMGDFQRETQPLTEGQQTLLLEQQRISEELLESFESFVTRYTKPGELGRLFQIELAKMTYFFQNRIKRSQVIMESLKRPDHSGERAA
jgi:hypothetical protein